MKNVIFVAACYLLTIALGYTLKQKGIFRKQDKRVFSNLIFYVTLPALLVSSYAHVSVNLWFLVAFVLGLLVNAVMVGTGILFSLHKTPPLKAIYTLNASGLNLANIAIPFLQNFYPTGIPYLCMFDTGDSFFTLGTTYAIASRRMGKGSGNPFFSILKSLVTTPAFDTYILMTLLSLLQVQLPSAVLSVADFMGRGNGFLAMIMVGISLEFHMDTTSLKETFRILSLRYVIGAGAAIFIFCVLPAPQIMRQILATAMFAAVPNIALIYNERLNISTDISATINPLSTILMLPLMALVMVLTM